MDNFLYVQSRRERIADALRLAAAKAALGICQGAGLVAGFIGMLAVIKAVGGWLA